MFKKILIFSLTLSIVLPASMMAQRKERHIRKGHRFFQFEDYYNAIEHYEKAYALEEKKPSKKKSKQELFFFRYAESNLETFRFDLALELYDKVLENEANKSLYPNILFRRAYALKHLGRYEEAAASYQAYLDSSPEDPWLEAKARQELKSCPIAKELAAENLEGVEVKPVAGMNTAYPNFGAHEAGPNRLYFTTMELAKRSAPKKVYRPGNPRYQVLGQVKQTDGKGNGPSELKGFKHPWRSIGNTALSPDGKYLFFSICEPEQAKKDLVCALYVAEKQGDDSWGEAQILPEPINLKGYTHTQAHVAYDSVEQKKWLYFVSDRPGGKGKLDIWRAEFTGAKSFASVECLGDSVNTPDDEATPFYHSKTRRLFFSSTWHEGLGSYDVFVSDYQGEGQFAKAQNLGRPFNSAGNDLYFVINADDSTGYLSSNRQGSMELFGEYCCGDIYRVMFSDKLQAKKEEPEPSPPVEPEIVQREPKQPEPKQPEQPSKPAWASHQEAMTRLSPVSIYFHDSDPIPNNFSPKAGVKYEVVFNSYMKRAEVYRAAFRAKQDSVVLTSLNRFFDTEAQEQYQNLNKFFEELQAYLDKGGKINLILEGHASALGNSRYNYAITQRRVDCLKQELLAFGKGSLQKHLDQGNLRLEEKPLGDAQAKSRGKQGREAVYGLEAVKDRRATIILGAEFK